MKLKTKRFSLKKLVAFIIISAILISTGITTIYLCFSENNLQSIEETSATAGGSLVLGSLNGSNTSQAYTMSSSDGNVYYCANPNYASSRRLRNSKQVDNSPAIAV